MPSRSPVSLSDSLVKKCIREICPISYTAGVQRLHRTTTAAAKRGMFGRGVRSDDAASFFFKLPLENGPHACFSAPCRGPTAAIQLSLPGNTTSSKRYLYLLPPVFVTAPPRQKPSWSSGESPEGGALYLGSGYHEPFLVLHCIEPYIYIVRCEWTGEGRAEVF